MRSASGEPPHDLILPEPMRGELKAPFGPVWDGATFLAEARKRPRLAAVGDVVTASLLDAGLVPRVAVVDGRTAREDAPALRVQLDRWPGRTVAARNPAGQITKELWRALSEAFKSKRHVLVRVAGEEDLAALACFALAPDGWTVVYGLPGRGVVAVAVDDSVRAKVQGILKRMEHGDAGAAAT